MAKRTSTTVLSGPWCQTGLKFPNSSAESCSFDKTIDRQIGITQIVCYAKLQPLDLKVIQITKLIRPSSHRLHMDHSVSPRVITDS